MKRLWSIILTVVMLAGTFAGCSNGEPSGSDSAPPPAQASAGGQGTSDTEAGDKKVISICWTSLPETKQQVWWDQVFDPFLKKHPDMEIEFQCIPDQVQTVRLQLTAGAAADLFSMDCTDVFDYATSDYMLDLESYRTQYDLDNKMYKWALDACEYDGRLFAIPHSVESSDMTYNLDLLKQLGFDGPPTTRAEYVAVCDAAIQADLIPISWGYSGAPVLLAWMYGHYMTTYSGPENVKALLTGETNFQDPNIRGAFEMMKADWDAGYINEKKSGAIDIDEGRSLFTNGMAVFNFEGSWLTMADTPPGTWQFEWGQTRWPSMRDGAAAAGDISVGECIGVNAKSPVADLGVEMLMDFFLNEQSVASAVAEGFSTPAVDINESLYPADMHPDIVKALACQDEVMNSEVVGYAPWGFFPPKTKVFLDDNLDKIFYDQMSIDEFLEQAQKLLDQDLADGYSFSG